MSAVTHTLGTVGNLNGEKLLLAVEILGVLKIPRRENEEKQTEPSSTTR